MNQIRIEKERKKEERLFDQRTTQPIKRISMRQGELISNPAAYVHQTLSVRLPVFLWAIPAARRFSSSVQEDEKQESVIKFPLRAYQLHTHTLCP